VIAKQLLAALSYMHVNNVTHRDLKLENLLLAKPNDISSVVIADFGRVWCITPGVSDFGYVCFFQDGKIT
jgi:serine/threonine protein kinase